MKHFLIALFACACNWAFSQNCNLSVSEKKHWTKAVTFVENATSNEDYLLAVREFEQILVSNTSCPDVYYNLGLICTKLIPLKGEEFANKAKDYFGLYTELKSEETDTIEEELTAIEALLEKYHNDLKINSLKHIEGVWEKKFSYNGKDMGHINLQISNINGDLNIIYNEKNTFNIQIQNNGISFDKSTQYDGIDYDEDIGQYDFQVYITHYYISLLNPNQLKLHNLTVTIQYYRHGKMFYEDYLEVHTNDILERIY
ncbi:hypothetical protein ACPYIV_16575 [Parabacteroides sp. ASD2025]|uniref:hypothetical protein n=1 Tax=Parabacteroides sp. ASD2025 TaxID=3415987 RepID=UPI00260648D8|nr:hypothetical protein [uncultured Parabacteroides sp.]